MQSKYVIVEISAEFKNDVLISQLAISGDIRKINREVIESVRFKFVTKNFIGKKNTVAIQNNLLDAQPVQLDNSLYESGEELLNDILKQTYFKHHKQLRYLSEQHSDDIIKIQFILNPFSFIFLLVGHNQYHIVLETLDTEEATYLWHFDKNPEFIPSYLKEVDRQLNVIQNQGRQAFLEKNPENFSRILHNYANEPKGFIEWKDLLQERLF